jgi:NAD(P)-dependent dehydrogenase (short-subunit alcohol dehydrogenase family)
MSEDFCLSNKTILVTGASSGIGKETAIQIAKMKGRVIATARNKEHLEQLLNILDGDEHSMFVCDLTNDQNILELIKELPNIDGIAHCAGIVQSFPIAYLNRKKIDETFNLNVYGTIQLISGLLKEKKINSFGSIVCMSSISAFHPHVGGSMYSAAKAAIESFSKTLAIENASKKIRSNTIAAAMVYTPMYEQAELLAKESLENHIKKYPLGVGSTKDIANAMIYLLSPASKWITGTTLVMDGGLLLGY